MVFNIGIQITLKVNKCLIEHHHFYQHTKIRIINTMSYKTVAVICFHVLEKKS